MVDELKNMIDKVKSGSPEPLFRFLCSEVLDLGNELGRDVELIIKFREDKTSGDVFDFSAPVGFDEFWQAYPRKDAKKAAERAYKKIKADDRALILQDIGKRLASTIWDLKQKQYIPLPASYLNGERWKDELDTRGHQNDHIGEYFNSRLAPSSSTVHEADESKLLGTVQQGLPRS